jgi:predicted lysophospholipase L1 biosynthesis ABC-type transport system permease subunit
VIASCFALLSFAAAIVVGIRAGNTTQTILVRATAIMLVCWVIGLAVGAVAQWAIMEHVGRYKRNHPIPDDSLPDL